MSESAAAVIDVSVAHGSADHSMRNEAPALRCASLPGLSDSIVRLLSIAKAS